METAMIAVKGSKCVFMDNNSALKKTRRKRTSAADQVTLEAAYLSNSKPDKDERAAIVSQVDMTKKEVEVWFQNRRQKDNRRSKPLDEFELDVQVIKASASPSPKAEDGRFEQNLVPKPANDVEVESPSDNVARVDAEQSVAGADACESAIIKTDTPPKSPVVRGKPDNASSPGSARKRQHAEMSANNGVPANGVLLVQEYVPVKSREPIKRASSMRLATMADGSVKVRTRDTPTPSPPKQRMLPLTSDGAKRAKISRSVSMFEPSQVFADASSDTKLAVKPVNYGRSRDARAWEFYCDKGPKELTKQAEAQHKGSAVGAINLIRSTSSVKPRRVLGDLPKNTNGTRAKTTKPKITRAQSSVARLQVAPASRLPQAAASIRPFDGPVEADTAVVNKIARSIPRGRRPRRTCGFSDGEESDDGYDSDKENWKPGTRQWRHELRNGGEYLVPFGVDLDLPVVAPPARPQSQPAVRYAIENGVVVRDLGAATTSTTTQALPTADLDVVQGLLSLGRGAWR
ncbi:uncharacterized protein AB675_7067 [Cyphellophora attinorum]|uniref:Homeobox domain-containing protein n=1 Tax=Cyphellophora attinorum TaxID=1664694 RepID=A0A0N1HYB2_9EURO|nr:uncharacterized protein AB675_7067 [Phialophora attinorum]KPI43332.1 hypothetical protein AB675_7067 [Phialophora attinorum]